MKIYQVDAFTNKAFSGNPAAVCLLDAPARENWMQHVASEMNLSETAFLYKESAGYRLRWFTPTSEVKLCGHATLASSHILYETGIEPAEKKLEFYTLSGTLRAWKKDDYIEMAFPGIVTKPAEITDVYRKIFSRNIRTVSTNEEGYMIIELSSQEEIHQFRDDFQELKKLGNNLIMITSRSEDGSPYDFISRVFAPAFGIDEDPVTGSAHCALALFWKDKLNKDTFTAFQASRRSGILELRVIHEGVVLGGQAVTVMDGSLRV